jgi:hypothetical protein
MKACTVCAALFRPKRSEQVICSVRCRQVNNARNRLGQKTGPQSGRVYRVTIDRDGYRRVYAGTHPYAEGRKMIGEHVLRMEMMIGRRIGPTECVHHVNEDKQDNRPENLVLMTRSAHSKLHGPETANRRTRTGGRFA